MITIIDYDAGNIRSVVNMLRAIGVKSRIASTPDAVMQADRLILPGVGHFDHGMKELAERGLIDALNTRVLDDGIPVLGICLGAQLLTRGSAEGDRPGLGWIDGETVPFDRSRMDAALRVPHMGWADTWVAPETSSDNPLTNAVDDDARFYYVHTYHLACDNPEQSILTTHHGYDFTAGVHRNNVLGVQFHPEKSHRFGMPVLKAFSTWRPDAADNAGETAA